jgi:alkylhydroperoxidase/carboxymuconolactone decarboxylase family protein YurZ
MQKDMKTTTLEKNAEQHIAFEQFKNCLKEIDRLIGKHLDETNFPDISKLTKELNDTFPKIQSLLTKHVKKNLQETMEDLPDYTPNNNAIDEVHSFRKQLQVKVKALLAELNKVKPPSKGTWERI